MNKKQEARILSNQILIMQAVGMLLVDYPAGRTAARNQLDLRIKDTETFIREFLK